MEDIHVVMSEFPNPKNLLNHVIGIAESRLEESITFRMTPENTAPLLATLYVLFYDVVVEDDNRVTVSSFISKDCALVPCVRPSGYGIKTAKTTSLIDLLENVHPPGFFEENPRFVVLIPGKRAIKFNNWSKDAKFRSFARGTIDREHIVLQELSHHPDTRCFTQSVIINHGDDLLVTSACGTCLALLPRSEWPHNLAERLLCMESHLLEAGVLFTDCQPGNICYDKDEDAVYLIDHEFSAKLQPHGHADFSWGGRVPQMKERPFGSKFIKEFVRRTKR
jgi:hypothetical protein